MTASAQDDPSLLPGDAIGVHRHLREDEIVFVTRGTARVQLGKQQYTAGAGTTVFIPQGTCIALANAGRDTFSMVFVFSSPGFERVLRELSSAEGEPAQALHTREPGCGVPAPSRRSGTGRLLGEEGQVSVPVALAWSGGKDSSLALAALRADPSIEVVALLTTVTRDYDRISMHGVRRSILEAQVSSLGLPLVEATIPAAASNELYEEALAAALDVLRRQTPGVRHLAFGDLFLTDVRAYREHLLAPLGWSPVFPLWGQDTAQLARRFVDQGYRAILTCVDTTQLDADFAGREFDARLLEELPVTVDPCGERGEFHTCVYDGPIFRQPLAPLRGERVRRDNRFEYCDLRLPTADSAA